MDGTDTDIHVLGDLLHDGRVSRGGTGRLWPVQARRAANEGASAQSCAQRVKPGAFTISDASFLLLRGSVVTKKKWDAVGLQTPSSRNEPGVRGPAQRTLEQFGRNGLTADKERDARPQFLLCGTRIRQVPPASIFSETLV